MILHLSIYFGKCINILLPWFFEAIWLGAYLSSINMMLIFWILIQYPSFLNFAFRAVLSYIRQLAKRKLQLPFEQYYLEHHVLMFFQLFTFWISRCVSSSWVLFLRGVYNVSYLSESNLTITVSYLENFTDFHLLRLMIYLGVYLSYFCFYK